MALPRFTPPRSLAWGAVHGTDPAGFEIAIFGAPHGTPYPTIDNRVHEATPNALRAVLAEEHDWIDHWDFDLDGTLLDDEVARAIDLGDLQTRSQDGPGNRVLIEQATRAILAAGAAPVMIGGDDSTPIPFLAGFAGHGPITVVQIDAHIDWRQERFGEPLGYSSTMRRASEMAHVERIVQVGIRGVGSARRQEVEDARRWGARIVRATDIHEQGVDAALAHVSEGTKVVVTFDCDSLDAALMPAVMAPTAGGLRYEQVTRLLEGIAAKADLIGFELVEFVPARDRDGIAAHYAARIVSNAIGRLARRKRERLSQR